MYLSMIFLPTQPPSFCLYPDSQWQTGPASVSLHSSCVLLHVLGTSAQVIATIIYVLTNFI